MEGLNESNSCLLNSSISVDMASQEEAPLQSHTGPSLVSDPCSSSSSPVKFVLSDGVEVSGGGLGHTYSTLQFHFHWGNESDHPKGSEHMVDSVRYPMEVSAVFPV